MSEIIEPQEIAEIYFEGEGTQENPYQITTVAEFRAMNDSNAYFKLMNNLDVNDTQWASGWGNVTLRFKEFDGNGHEIRNIVSSQEKSITINDGGGAGTTGHTKNLKLLNCIVNHDYFIQRAGSYDYFVNFTNCQVSITGTNVANVLYRTRLIESALTLSGLNCTAINQSTVKGLALERCHVLLDLDNTGTTDRIFDEVKETSIRGKLKTPTSGITIYNISNYWSNSYFACEVPEDGVPLQLSAYTPTGVNFINRELINRSADVGGGYNLTTAQCKDKDYLNSIGFEIGRASCRERV